MDDAISKHKEDANRNDLLIWASARGLISDAKELVSQGALPTTKDKKGLTPLHYAASHGHKDLGEFLAAHGADVDVEDPEGRTPLHYAAAGGHLEMVKFLSTKLVWLDGYDAHDDTALHLAARRGDLALIKFLCAKDCKVNLVNKRGLTPLGEALVGGHVAAAEALLGVGAHADVTARGYTLLHLVCGLGLGASTALLLGPKAKADPNEASNTEALTPLHAAAMAGSLECVELLLSNGANAAAQSSAGLMACELVPSTAPEASSKASAKEDAKAAKQLSEVRTRLEAAAVKAGGKKTARGPGGAKAGEAGKGPAASGKGGDAGKATFQQRFASLARDEQMLRLNRYVGSEDSQLPPDLPADAKTQVQELRKAQRLLTCVKAVAALRADEDFQTDIVNPDVKAAMQVIKETNSTEKYAHDSRVQGVMAKMNRLQAVLKANGNPQLTLDDILAAPSGPRSLPETERRAQAMEATVKEMQEQALLLLMGKAPPETPKQAASAESQAGAAGGSKAASDAKQGAGKEGAKGQAKGEESKEKGAEHDKGGGKGKSKAAPKTKAPFAPPKKAQVEIEELPNTSPSATPPFGDRFGMSGRPRANTWQGWLQEFGYELVRQGGQSLIVMACSFFFMWLFGMLPSDWTTKASTQQDLASAAEAVRATLRTAAGGVIEGLEEAELPGEQPIIM